MRQGIIIASFVGFLIIFTNGGIINAALCFLLVGAIPGTSLSIPVWLMLVIYIVVALYIVSRTTSTWRAVAKQTRRAQARSARMPRLRYQATHRHLQA